MIAGTLEVQILSNLARLQSDMNQAKSIVTSAVGHISNAVAGATKVLAGLGIGLSAVAFSKFVKDAIDAADTMNDLRTRTGATAQELLILQGAAVRGGTSLQAIDDVTSKLGKRLGAAAIGTGEAAAAFKAMDIDIKRADGSTKGMNEILREAGERFKEYEDGADKATLATAAFGKGGDKLIPVIQGIAETEERFKRLGITINDDLLTAADNFNDKMEDMRSLNDQFGRELASVLLPYLDQFITALIEARSGTSALSDMVSAVIIPLKVFATGFLTIATTVASATDVIFGFILAAERLKSLDFSGARTEALTGMQSAGDRIGTLSKTVSALWSDPQKREAMATVQEPKRAAPRLPGAVAGGGGGGDPDAAYRRLVQTLQDKLLVESQLTEVAKLQRDLDRMSAKDLAAITPLRRAELEDLAKKVDLKLAEAAGEKLAEARRKNELDAFKGAQAQRQQALDFSHEQNTISDKAYFQQKIAMAQEAAEKETAVINATLALQLEAQKKTADGSAAYLKAQQDIEDSQARLGQVQQTLTTSTQQMWQQMTKAAEQYKRAMEDVDTEIMSLTGRTQEAALRQFDRSKEDLFKKASLPGADPADLERLNRLRALVGAQAGFNEERQKLSDINSRLQMDEERTQNLYRIGAISELEAMARTGKARQDTIKQQEAIVANLQKIAQESQNPALILQADQAAAALERLRLEADVLGQKFEQIFTGAAADAFAEFIDGSKTAKEAFKSFSDSVVKQINRLVSEALSKKLFQALGLGAGENGESGIFGMFGGLLGGSGEQGQKTGSQTSGGIGGILGKVGGLFGMGGNNHPLVIDESGAFKGWEKLLKPSAMDSQTVVDPKMIESMRQTPLLMPSIPGVSAVGSTITGGLGEAANSAAFSTAITTAGTSFGSLVTTAATTASTTLSAELTAAGTAFGPEILTASASLAAELSASGAAFAAEVTAAGSSFAAMVASTSPGGMPGLSAPGLISDIGGGGFMDVLDEMPSFLGSFATGIDNVPQDGLAFIHKNERIVPANENKRGERPAINVQMTNHFAGPVDKRSLAQVESAAFRGAQRANARNN